jgi:RNA polymerase sigma-70 factor (ECF subfamily)
LLARLKDWSQQTAWRQFDHDYTPLLRNVARKAGLTEAEADEVMQETLIAVAKKIGEFQHSGRRGSFRAWLYQQARWRIADQFRTRKRTNPCSKSPMREPAEAAQSPHETMERGCRTSGSPENLAMESEADPTFERIWDSEWDEHVRRSALARVKAQVSPGQYQLFDLHVLQGLSVREAAKAAATTMAAVYMAKSRVIRLLKRQAKALVD